jgi:hypothetical protein
MDLGRVHLQERAQAFVGRIRHGAPSREWMVPRRERFLPRRCPGDDPGPWRNQAQCLQLRYDHHIDRNSTCTPPPSPTTTATRRPTALRPIAIDSIRSSGFGQRLAQFSSGDSRDPRRCLYPPWLFRGQNPQSSIGDGGLLPFAPDAHDQADKRELRSDPGVQYTLKWDNGNMTTCAGVPDSRPQGNLHRSTGLSISAREQQQQCSPGN